MASWMQATDRPSTRSATASLVGDQPVEAVAISGLWVVQLTRTLPVQQEPSAQVLKSRLSTSSRATWLPTRLLGVCLIVLPSFAERLEQSLEGAASADQDLKAGMCSGLEALGSVEPRWLALCRQSWDPHHFAVPTCDEAHGSGRQAADAAHPYPHPLPGDRAGHLTLKDAGAQPQRAGHHFGRLLSMHAAGRAALLLDPLPGSEDRCHPRPHQPCAQNGGSV